MPVTSAYNCRTLSGKQQRRLARRARASERRLGTLPSTPRPAQPNAAPLASVAERSWPTRSTTLAALLAGSVGTLTCREAVTDHLSDTAIPAVAGTLARVSEAIAAHPVPFASTYGTLLAGVAGLEWARRRYVTAAGTSEMAARRERWWWHTGTYLMGYGLAAALAQMAATGFSPANPEFQVAYGDGLVAAGMMTLMHVSAHDHADDHAAAKTRPTPVSLGTGLRWLLTGLCLIDDAAWPMLGLLRAGVF